MLDWLLTKQAQAEPLETTPEGSKIAGASSLDPSIAALAERNEYMEDLLALLSQYPELEQANQTIAQKAQETAALVETDKQLQVLTKLDEQGRAARVNIHKTLAQHYTTIAKNNAELGAVNNSYVLGMAGYVGQQERQNAELSGILKARQAIANRVRGMA